MVLIKSLILIETLFKRNLFNQLEDLVLVVSRLQADHIDSEISTTAYKIRGTKIVERGKEVIQT